MDFLAFLEALSTFSAFAPPKAHLNIGGTMRDFSHNASSHYARIKHYAKFFASHSGHYTSHPKWSIWDLGAFCVGGQK